MTDSIPFDQRYGAAPLPSQLKPDEISAKLAALLWGYFHKELEGPRRRQQHFSQATVNSAWRLLLWRWHVFVEHKPSDSFSDQYQSSIQTVRAIIYDRGWATLYKFVEFVLDAKFLPDGESTLAFILEDSLASWRIINGKVVPISSPEQAEAIIAAVADTDTHGPDGAKAHLRNASAAIAAADWAGSIRESIHAVESIACTIGDGKTLGDALKHIRTAGEPVHPALLAGFSKLYGYTSDQSGIRHALLDEQSAAAGENEAIFMFGACASFCQYLLNATR